MAFSGTHELMSRKLSAPFFSATPVFTRADYASAVGRAPSDKTVTAMLSQHVKAGNIKRIARGLYASVPKHADAATWWVDRFLVASRLRPDAVFGYHSALELHGYAYTAEFDVQAIAPGEPGLFKTAEFSCRFVRPTTPLGPDSVTTVDRLGQAVSVTTLERTVADLFDRRTSPAAPRKWSTAWISSGVWTPTGWPPIWRPTAMPRPLARGVGGWSLTANTCVSRTPRWRRSTGWRRAKTVTPWARP